jgi:hypothetical protein
VANDAAEKNYIDAYIVSNYAFYTTAASSGRLFIVAKLLLMGAFGMVIIHYYCVMPNEEGKVK